VEAEEEAAEEAALSPPVAVIVASPRGVEVKPVVDVTKIVFAALTALGFVWASWKGMSREERRHAGRP
jgi:hypothetical protein